MNKKNFISLLLTSIFFFSIWEIFSAPINLSHKAWEYKNIFDLEIKFSEPVKKILWTKNPNWSPDEIFVYEKKIPIKYSQDIWYLWLLDWYWATKFFINKYILKINPNKFNYWFKISRFSPNNNWIEIRNEWEFTRILNNRTLSSLNFEETIPFLRLKPWETIQVHLEEKNEIWDDMDRIKLLDPNWQTQFRIQFKKNIWKNNYYEKEFWENLFKIKKY